MIAVDTNVLVRLVVNDDVAQQAAARRRVEEAADEGRSVFITTVVIAELTWVLESAYDYDRGAIADVVEALLETEPFVVERRDAVMDAVLAYRSGRAGLADHLILAVSQARGAAPLLSFDRKLAAEQGCELP